MTTRIQTLAGHLSGSGPSARDRVLSRNPDDSECDVEEHHYHCVV
jgi:hypothetical protein